VKALRQALPYKKNGVQAAPPGCSAQIKLRGLSVTFFTLCIVCYSYGEAPGRTSCQPQGH
jgi:hypothetical protein